MDIEIVEIGGAGRWIIGGPRVRIGREQHFEVCLSDPRYAALTGEALTLELVDGVIRLAALGSVRGGTFLNDNPARAGFVVRSGDIVRLGAEGPELRIRLIEHQQPAGYAPTRVLDEPVQATYEPTRVGYEPTRVLSSQETTVISPPPQRPAAAPGRYGYETQVMNKEAVSRAAVQPNSGTAAAPRWLDEPVHNGGSHEAGRNNNDHESRMPGASSASAADSSKLLALESTLKGMRMILWANLAVLAVLLLLVFQLSQQLDRNRQELQELRAQAQSAVGQLTPALDARLNVFEKRMDSIDAKMKQAEDRLVGRMNTEIPPMLDKYIGQKLAAIKH